MIPVTMKVWKLWCSGMIAMLTQAALGWTLLYLGAFEDLRTAALCTLLVSPIIIGWVNRWYWRKYK